MSDLYLLSERDYADPDECACECHQHESDADEGCPHVKVEHVGPCCEVCRHCGMRIMVGAMQLHLVECGAGKPSDSPDWVQDREFDDVSHVDVGQPPV